MSADPEPIRLWRDTFHLNLNIGRKTEIIQTVKDLELWKRVIADWKANKWNPLKIGWQLSEYERRAANERERSNATTGNQRVSEAQAGAAGVPERSDRGMLPVRQRAGIHLRRGGETLEEILTAALRANHRP